MGSKARLAKNIAQIINPHSNGWNFVEPFAGGLNLTQNILASSYTVNDGNKYVAAMWTKLLTGWIPEQITKAEYNQIKANKQNYPDYLVGWCGVACSYSGKWFAGFAGKTATKIQTVRDYQQEALNSALKTVDSLKHLGIVEVTGLDYRLLQIPDNSVVYCDPPYANTTGYHNSFDSVEFFEWCRQLAKRCKVFVSEYTAPNDFQCVFSKEVKSSLSANGTCGGSIASVEKLFTI